MLLKPAAGSPVKVGLTGSMGMGKSTVTKQLVRLGFPVFDADATVHALYAAQGKAVEPMRALCPSAIVDGAVDRKKLMEAIMGDATHTLIARIEGVVHPLVEQEKFLFYEHCQQEHSPIVFYDIPLLFETLIKRQKSAAAGASHGQYLSFDYVLSVTADAQTQRRRVLARPGMTEEKFAAILAKQVPDAYKREHSDFLVRTDFEGFGEARAQLAHAIERIVAANMRSVLSTLEKLSAHHKEGASTAQHLVITDDSLFDVEALTARKRESLFRFAQSKMPSLLAAQGEYNELIRQARIEHPLVAHDELDIEGRVLKQLTKACSSETEHSHAAVEAVESALQEAHAFLRADALAAISQAKQRGMRVAVLSNEPVTKNSFGDISNSLDLVLSARELGTTSESILPLLCVCQLWKCSPSSLLVHSSSNTIKNHCQTLGMHIITNPGQ